jgi:hypothetical protein
MFYPCNECITFAKQTFQMYNRLLTFTFTLFSFFSLAQTPGTQRIESYQLLKVNPSPLQGLPFTNIGPTVMSGRVTDLEVNPQNPHEFFVAYASGGVFYSNNNGLTLTPVFDQEAALTIGDMAMDWKNNLLWVGTGEVNSSRSSYAGTGLYQSADRGKTWKYLGLEESHHIGKIVLNPRNSAEAWVAVLGHLYTSNPERGIYKTSDGGKTWKQTLFVNDTTGCVDLIIHPGKPEILYAASWTRTRKAWHFNGCGLGSGIYQSTDGGENWKKITNGQNGFPENEGVGRIGLAICEKNPMQLYAVMDNNNHQDKPKDSEQKLDARELQKMSRENFLKIDDKKLESFLRDKGYPEQYTAESVKESIRKKEYTVADVADWYLSDADASLFDTPVYGAELYRSQDGGKTWTKTHDKPLEGVHFTYGYYFGTVAVSAQNPEKVLIAGYPLIQSTDGGKSFKQIDGDNCHPDYHRIWINPTDDQHMITGNDGGVNITYDGGQHWYKANNPAVGQFYAIQTDENKPYRVYGGLQDNGTWVGPSNHQENTGWHQSGAYAYKELGGGDGMQVEVDTRDNNTIYLGYQFGNYMRLNKTGNEYVDVKPVHQIGQKAYRFNWQTPIHLSRHQQDVFYLGSNQFHRSLQKGEKPESLSQDLAPTKLKGNVPYGTLSSISESPLQFGLIYVGSDNGFIHLSKDLGYTWTKISNALPQDLWVSRVIASKHKISRVYATLNGYRRDDFRPYVFRSDDYGRNWKDLSATLPHEPVNVIREDPANEQILYVGTDNGLYVSFDGGTTFMAWAGQLPRVAIHDLRIHEGSSEIILGTHGRSLYKSSLNTLRKYPEIQHKELYVFTVDSVRYRETWGKQFSAYQAAQEDSIQITYFVAEKTTVTMRLLNTKNKVLKTMSLQAEKGFNQINLPLDIPESSAHFLGDKVKAGENGKYYLLPADYRIEFENKVGKKESILIRLFSKK